MTFDDIDFRVPRLNDGRAIAFRDGERKTKALAWMLERYFGLKTEGVEVAQRDGSLWYQCFTTDFYPPPLTTEDLAAIGLAARYCNETTLGLWRNDCVRLPTPVGAPLEAEHFGRPVWTFTDRARADMCVTLCRDTFGLDAELQSYPAEWMVTIKGGGDGRPSLKMADYYRLQGALLVLADHTVTPAARAVKIGNAKGRTDAIMRGVGVPTSTAPMEPPSRHTARQVVRSRRTRAAG